MQKTEDSRQKTFPLALAAAALLMAARAIAAPADVPLIDALDVLTDAIVTCVDQLVQFPTRDSM